MRMPRRLGWLLTAAAVCAVAGCSGGRAVDHQAQQTYQRLTGADRAEAPPPTAAAVRPALAESIGAPQPKQVLFLAPREEPDALAAAENKAAESKPAGAKPGEAKPAEAKPGEAKPGEAKAAATEAGFASIEGQSFSEVLKRDLRETPGRLWRGTKYSFANAQNLVVLSLAFGADRIVRYNVDDDVSHRRAKEGPSSLHETGDFGSVAGNPFLHFGIGMAWYGIAVKNQDAKNHQFAVVLMEALLVNDAATGLLKLGVHDHSPNGERFSWPSGHMSSSVALASVVHEYYGWKPAIPLYLLSGYVGATRIEDREHNVSDLVFGAALGWVIGHSVVKGELPQLAGFTVLPYGGDGTGGLMLVRQW